MGVGGIDGVGCMDNKDNVDDADDADDADDMDDMDDKDEADRIHNNWLDGLDLLDSLADTDTKAARDLPMCLRIISREQNSAFTDIEQLPAHVRTELLHRFNEMVLESESRTARYAACTNDPEAAALKKYCIRKLVV